MITKEDFLKIKSFEEYEKRKTEFKSLDWSDQEIRNHIDSLFPKMTPLGYDNRIHIDVLKK